MQTIEYIIGIGVIVCFFGAFTFAWWWGRGEGLRDDECHLEDQ